MILPQNDLAIWWTSHFWLRDFEKTSQHNPQIRANTCACTVLTYVTVILDTHVLPTFAVTRAVN